ncbi:hypothetical protein vseg_021580 [Gypsophila vaccaria]
MVLEWWPLSGTVRWLGHRISYLDPTTWSGLGYIPQWDPHSINGVVDDVVWSVITAFESIALVSMLCCFFLACGCSI